MRKDSPAKWMAILLGLAVVALVAFASEDYEEKFDRTEALSMDGKVYLSNISGVIDVQTWKEAKVKIEALKTSRASSLSKAKENAELVKIEVTAEAGAVRVEVKYPERRGIWGSRSMNVSVDFKLWIPEKASAEINSVSGDVRMAKLGGQARVHCVSGEVDVLGAAGADIDLVSGDLTLEDIGGDLFMKTVSGDVRVTRIKGSIKSTSVSGNIDFKDVSEAEEVTAKNVSGNITYVGTIKAGGRYELKTHSGNVQMDIPADSSFDLEADTFNGVIDSQFQIQVMGKISPREIRGTVGKGGTLIKLSSFSGNVELNKR